MRDEDEIQTIADKAANILTNGRLDPFDKTTLIADDGKPYDVEFLRGIRDALDWALEDQEESPL